MLKRIDISGVLFAGGFVLSGIALRYQWSESTLFLVGMVVVAVLTFAARRLAGPKA